jgi:HK97 family phage portal protein
MASLIDRILGHIGPQPRREWPVGKGALVGAESEWGHSQDQFSPEEYGDYLATSNDIYSVVSARARAMSRLQLRFYRGDANDKEELPRSPAALLYKRVNRFWTSKRLARMDEMSMGVWGETYWAVERDQNGKPSEIWWLKPSRVVPVPHETGYISGYIYESVSGERIPFRADEIVWFRYPNPLDEFSPLSPLAAARLAADTATAMTQSGNSLFKNGLQAAGLIVPPADKVTFTDTQADDLELYLQRKLTGSKNAGKWAVLRYEAQFKPLSITPKDAESIAGLNMSFRQVCRAYGWPSPLLNDMEHATLSNLRELQKGAWEQTLIPDADLRAEEVEEQFLPLFRGGPDHCAYDYTQIEALQESASESWTREAQAIDRGALTINEWRKSKGYPPVEWGDKPYMPVNKGPIDDNGLPQLPQATDGASLPDDEVNPANQPASPRMLDHLAARRLLSSLTLNGVKL